MRFVATPPRKVDREAMAAAVARRVFREIDDAVAVQAVGWVGVHDPLATELTATDLFFQEHLVVGFRWDRRMVPPKLLYLERRRAEATHRAENANGRLGREARKQIRAEVADRLVARALPAPRLFDCAWNLTTGHLYFTGRLRAACEAFADLFRSTFGVAPVPLIPYLAAEHLGLSAGAVAAVRAVSPADLTARDVRTAIPRLALEEAEA
ncbi:MAG TPA: recombination-associated protein RdgC [Candidatus Binatia bacterium]|nr:recombination-associated protein RdgC [Candidatus Binatia bacterium]